VILSLLKRIILLLSVLSLVAVAMAQYGGGGRRRSSFGGRPENLGSGPPDRGKVPTWSINEAFARDIFTFARLKYSSVNERRSLAWWTDYADADLNLSFRLNQLTALKVHPDPKVIEITDPELFGYPWVFMSGVGNIVLSNAEAEILRKYLLSGGFLLVDDFWGEQEWANFYTALKKVFPDREPVNVPRSHPIFRCIFPLAEDLSLQTPNMPFAVSNKDRGVTWERPDAREVHFRAIFDDKERMLAMICHNTDNGDGWEEEGADPWFFAEFSEKKNYPLAINIIFWAMTH
jgi:hypothetical protein